MTKGIHPRLIKAYRETHYVAFAADEIVLKIGRVSRELSALMNDSSVETAAYLTASNPESQSGEAERWHDAQVALLSDLVALNVTYVAGEGRDPKGEWPTEASLLVLGIKLADADRLARKYRQNAFVWVGNGEGLPALKLMRPLQVPDGQELEAWRASLPTQQATVAAQLSPREQAALMSVPDAELSHWLTPELWDPGQLWPLARPDGSAMGAGTELDRVFKLISAGVGAVITEYAD